MADIEGRLEEHKTYIPHRQSNSQIILNWLNVICLIPLHSQSPVKVLISSQEENFSTGTIQGHRVTRQVPIRMRNGTSTNNLRLKDCPT